MPELIPHHRVHLVGAGGAGMSGLAKMLAQAGHVVSGSDLKPGTMLGALGGAGVDTWVGHRPEAVRGCDLVVVSSAVPDTDPEVRAALAAGIPVWERPELLARITKTLPTLGVAGTHGKTSGTALAVTALRAGGHDPSFMVGGRLTDLNTNAHLGDPGLFLLEADEAFGTFLSLSLRGLLVTNIEPDHLDHYGTVDAMEAAYATVAAGVAGPVVACIDDPGVRRLTDSVGDVVTYGETAGADWQVGTVRRDGFGVGVSVSGPAGEFEITLPKPGRHMALNAVGVVALLHAAGFDARTAAVGLARFGGVRRRFEIRVRRPDLTIVDDYAHHPTEVAATIAAARSGHPGRIVAVFQPHRYSRTAELGVALGAALSAADRVFVAEVYSAGEAPVPGVNGRLVAGAVEGPPVQFVPRRVDLAGAVAADLQPGDLVLTLGAGDVTGVPDELLNLLPGH